MIKSIVKESFFSGLDLVYELPNQHLRSTILVIAINPNAGCYFCDIFVSNAFKRGITVDDASWIKIDASLDGCNSRNALLLNIEETISAIKLEPAGAGVKLVHTYEV